MTSPTFEEAIAEVRREQAIRRRCYPQWVEAKRLSETNAKHQLAAMQLALETLEDLKHGLDHGLRTPSTAKTAEQITLGFSFSDTPS